MKIRIKLLGLSYSLVFCELEVDGQFSKGSVKERESKGQEGAFQENSWERKGKHVIPKCWGTREQKW